MSTAHMGESSIREVENKSKSDKKVPTKTIKTVDSKLRIQLPSEFAGSKVEIESINEYEVRVRKVVTIPASELWAWQKPGLLQVIAAGLDQVRLGETLPGPDLEGIARELGLGVEDDAIE